MVRLKDRLKDYFIITGSRTVKALVQNGIVPDMVVSIDPVDVNYEMMKDYLDLDVPLVFYELQQPLSSQDYKGGKF